MIIQACDPGLNGAFVTFNLTEGTLDVVDMPVVEIKKKREVSEQLCADYIGGCDHFFIERQNARPGQGVSSMFKLGVNYGIIKGIVAAKRIPMHVVTPANGVESAWCKKRKGRQPGARRAALPTIRRSV